MNVIIDWKIVHGISDPFESLLADCFPLSLLKKKMFYPLSLWSHFSQRGCCVVLDTMVFKVALHV